jgi:hypothetical protein
MNLKTKILGAITAPIAGLALLAMALDPGPAAAAGSHPQTQGGGQGMMGGGMMGGGMMGRGMMKMMRGMMAQGSMGQGMMGRGALGHGAMGQGMRVVPGLNVTVKDVRLFMEKRLERLGNKRLKVGPVKKADERTITADIVTVDNSLVRRFTVDSTTGWVKKAK